MFRYFAGFALLSLSLACVEAPPSSNNVVPTNNPTNNAQSNNAQSNNSQSNSAQSNNSQSNNATSGSNNSNNQSNNTTTGSNNATNNSNNTSEACSYTPLIAGRMTLGSVEIDRLDDVVLFGGRFSQVGVSGEAGLKFGVVEEGVPRVFNWAMNVAIYDISLKSSDPIVFDLATVANDQISLFSCTENGCGEPTTFVEPTPPQFPRFLTVQIYRDDANLIVVHESEGELKVREFGEDYVESSQIRLKSEGVVLRADDLVRGAGGLVLSGMAGNNFFRVLGPPIAEGVPAQCTDRTSIGGRTRGILGSNDIVIEQGSNVRRTSCSSVEDVSSLPNRNFAVAGSERGTVGVVASALNAITATGSLILFYNSLRHTLATGKFWFVRAVDIGDDILVFGGDEDSGMHLFRGTPEQLLECNIE